MSAVWDRQSGLSLLSLLSGLLLLCAVAGAQEAAVERGSQLYRVHCATPYCHGPAGAAGRAPKLIGRKPSLITGVIKDVSEVSI